MAYKNNVADWAEFDLAPAEVASILATVQSAFKRAGGRGELPKATSMRNALKGKVSCDAAAFGAGNVTAEDGDVALAKDWAEAIVGGRGTLDQLKDWPALHKMVATMLKPTAPPAPPAPASKRIEGAHGVTVARKVGRPRKVA